MITRLYVNNFRCLVAFEAEFDSFGVLCGPNGAGKSSVFDALRLLQNLGTGDASSAARASRMSGAWTSLIGWTVLFRSLS